MNLEISGGGISRWLSPDTTGKNVRFGRARFKRTGKHPSYPS